MYGECENCMYADNCKKTIGIIWGYCNTDFSPIPSDIDRLNDDITNENKVIE